MAVKAFELFGEVSLKGDKTTLSGLKSISGQVNVTTKDLGNLRSEIDKTSKAHSNFSQGFLSSFGIQRGNGIGALLGSGAGNLLQSGAKALYGHITDQMEKGMDFADQIQQWKFAFKDLLGETEGIAHLRDLLKFGKDSAFATADVIDYAQQLEAVGIKTKEAIPIITALGDTIAAAGKFNPQNMQSAVTAIMQMLSMNRVGGQEMRQQLGQVVANPWGFMARGLGVSEEKARTLAESDQLNAQSAIRIMIAEMAKEKGGLLEKLVPNTISGAKAQRDDQLLFLSAASMLGQAGPGGDLLGTPGGAFAQYLSNVKTQTGLYSGPQAAAIGQHLGSTAEMYYGAIGTLEQNAFQSDWLTDLLHGDPTSANKKLESLGQMIPKGLSDGIYSSTETVIKAADSAMGTNVWKTLEDFWETHSPSKKTMRMGEDVGDGFRLGLEKALSDPRVKAMLDVIGFAEGTDNKHGYATKVGGGNQGDLSQKNRSVVNLGGGLKSSASGRYQFLNSTWDALAQQLGLTDFSPHSQDLAATKLLQDSGALTMLQKGDFKGAVAAARKTWASFPGAGYGQGERTMGSLEKVFQNSLAIGGSPVTSTNPVPVQIVDFGNSVPLDIGESFGYGSSIFKKGANTSGLKTLGPNSIPKGMLLDRTISDSVPVNAGNIFGHDDPLTTTGLMLNEKALMLKKPLELLTDVVTEAAGGLGNAKEQIEADFGPAIKAGKAKKGKRDKLFDAAFTKEGVAGDFESGFTSLLSGLGHDKPMSLLKQFGLGMLQDIQGRISHDISAQLTGAIFGGRGEDGKLTGGLFGGAGNGSGGLLSSIFGKLFGGFRASGGSMSSGRFYVAGENGPELISGPGHVYNSSQTHGMMAGGGDTVIVAFGDRQIGRATDAYSRTPKGRRAKVVTAKYERLLRA